MNRLLIGGALGGMAGALLVYILGVSSPSGGSSPTGVAPGGPVSAAGDAAFSYASAVNLAAPSVVNIFTSKVTTERHTLKFKDPLMQHYYGKLLPEQIRKHMETSLGSGVVVSPDGYVLTNLHILEDADEVKVVLADGGNVPVSIVGQDADTDLAILKMETGQAPTIPVGDTDKLKVGDVALAIGNPFGVGQTVTLGIISATGRSHLGISAFENFIQTDAAINPGNSGGALINARGELIGINTAIFSKSGGSHGIGFAIPADLAMNVLRQIVSQGRVARGWIGITGQEVNRKVREAFALHTGSGVLISGVVEDGPADRAGFRAGDVVTHIEKRALVDIHDMLEIIANAGPSRELIIAGWRGSQRFERPTITVERPKLLK